MRKIITIFFKLVLFIFLGFIIFVFIRSSMDIYNDFAFDRAILRDSPSGYTLLLDNSLRYNNYSHLILCGDYVYVEDWLSAYNGRVSFAKVKSRLTEGYINRDLLVEANINVKPIISLILIVFIIMYSFRKIYNKFAI